MKRFVSSEIRLLAQPAEIIDALVEPGKLKEWWGISDAFIQPRDNGLYTITWLTGPDGIRFISTGRIRLYNWRSTLELEDLLYLNAEKGIFGPCLLKFDTIARNSFTILKVTQEGFEKGDRWDWYYDAVRDGWPEALIMLKKYLET